eukprot:s3217_g2.t1
MSKAGCTAYALVLTCFTVRTLGSNSRESVRVKNLTIDALSRTFVLEGKSISGRCCGALSCNQWRLRR